MSENKLFLQQFREHFFEIGAILPSSQAASRAMVAYVAQKKGPVRILEAGAGTGAFTGQITSHLEPGDTFDAVEINPKLITVLQERLAQEAQLRQADVEINIINDDVRNLPPDNLYDYIVFSLPLTNFPPSLVESLLTEMMSRLKPGGIFSYIRYILLGRFKYALSGSDVKTEMQANKAIISRFAGQYQIGRRAVLQNVPPAWVFYWQK